MTNELDEAIKSGYATLNKLSGGQFVWAENRSGGDPIRLTVRQLGVLLEAAENWKGIDGADTGLLDTCGKKIKVGSIVHWTDGGDEYDIETRIAERWDRIAVVYKDGIEVCFKVIDSPSEKVRQYMPDFRYGSFIYKNTAESLTVVAASEHEYRQRFINAGEAMRHVLKLREEHNAG